MDKVTRITPSERTLADPTPGIAREQAIADGGRWVGVARTQAGVVSGWHHHGDHETTVYVEAGAFRVESGAGGSEVVDAGAGDFVVIPSGLVHRESNPSDDESRLIVFRVGTGPPTINVDGPSA
jgi:uncharacterized RmlC-like cupin family protein